MAVGKFQPFVKGDSIYCMDTETGALWEYNEKIAESWVGADAEGRHVGWQSLKACMETIAEFHATQLKKQ